MRALSALVVVVSLLAFPAGARAEGRARPVAPEWIADGVLAGVWLAMLPLYLADPTTEAAFGPSFEGPEAVGLFSDPVDGSTVGRPHQDRPTAPTATVAYMTAGALAGALLLSGGLAPWIDERGWPDRSWYVEQLVAAMVGTVHAILGTAVLTQLAKVATGRLRPDFADRADRYYCWQVQVPTPYRPRCDDLRATGELGPAVDAMRLDEGRRSFWSGHSALSFAAATYASLVVGGRLVWGPSANAATRVLGVLAQAGSFAGAAYIAASRVSDGAHHWSDVAVGAGVGVSMALLGYFLHFDRHGEVRPALRFALAPARAGAAVTLGGSF